MKFTNHSDPINDRVKPRLTNFDDCTGYSNWSVNKDYYQIDNETRFVYQGNVFLPHYLIAIYVEVVNE